MNVRCCHSGFATACDALLSPRPCLGPASDNTVCRAAGASSAAALFSASAAVRAAHDAGRCPYYAQYGRVTLALLHIHAAQHAWRYEGLVMQSTAPGLPPECPAMATMCCMHSPPRACPRIASARVSQASSDTACRQDGYCDCGHSISTGHDSTQFHDVAALEARVLMPAVSKRSERVCLPCLGAMLKPVQA